MLTQSTAGQSAGPTDPAGLVLERLPSGDYAWLRPALDAAIRDAAQVDQDLTHLLDRGRQQPEVRYVLTDAGRRALDEAARDRAMHALFGYPWPTLAEVQP